MANLKSAVMLFTKQAQIGPWSGLSNIMYPCSSRGWKTTNGQIWRSEKRGSSLSNLLSKMHSTENARFDLDLK